MTFEELPKVIINLPERNDRKDKLFNELKAIGAGGNYILSPGIIDSKPSAGIGKAHLQAMEHGFSNNASCALIMEDDVWFPGKHKTIAYINECLANAPKDWDILLGGLYAQQGQYKHNSHWDHVDEFSGLHFYIIKRSAYEKIKMDYKFRDHIDKWISKNNFKVYVSNPFFAMQHDGYSDNVKYVTKYNKLYLKRFNVLK